MNLRVLMRLLGKLNFTERGFDYAERFRNRPVRGTGAAPEANRLREFFDARRVGRGIFKWEHYFDPYDRHLRKFVHRNPKVLEIGILAGGSLEMWKEYFGPCQIYGVDINPACRAYESEGVGVFIGDQGSAAFWKSFQERVPELDVIIDDGSHRPEDQIVTLEQLLPMLRTGGVYICEDVHGEHNGFFAYAHGLAKRLNAMTNDEPTEFQRWIASIHTYPYMTIIEKSEQPTGRFRAPRHGTEWVPRPPDPRVSAP